MVRSRKPDDMLVRFPAGTRDEIEIVLKGRERPADFVRLAVDRLLRKRSAPGRQKGTAVNSPG